ncbi:MAG: hypothetical protein ACW967_02840 [Candidatus Hodarchaeales archaeon]
MIASTILDFPLPLGPIRQTNPLIKGILTVLLPKDLNPLVRISFTNASVGSPEKKTELANNLIYMIEIN